MAKNEKQASMLKNGHVCPKKGGEVMQGIFSKENIEKILDYVSDAVQIINARGKIIYCNRASAKLDGVEQNAILGKHVLEIYPSLDEDTSTLLGVIKTGKKIVNLQQSFINYKGESITTVNSSFPIKEGEKIVGAIEISFNITQMKKLTEKVVDLQTKLYKGATEKRKQLKGTAKYTFSDIIGNSRVMRIIKERAMKASENSSSVIIYGDTGTGKELLVQSIHNYSNRFNKPFIAQNCAAIPNTLLESILFGTVKGSFTGAEDRKGLFELANGGTLFLDEINSMPLTLQAKLLRVLEDGFIRRVGDVKTYDIDVRIITAMNMNPKEAVEKKLLRKDLYYRLNVLSIRVPDLVERREDIFDLSYYFIGKYNSKFGKQVNKIERQVMDIFLTYAWPGNVRELQHVIEGAMNIASDDIITKDDLPHYFAEKEVSIGWGKSERKSLRKCLDELEKALIIDAMASVRGNVTNAAKRLEIPRQTLQYKIEKFNI